MTFAAALALSAAACDQNKNTPPPDDGEDEENSVYTFHDEFDGDSIDRDKWDYQNGDGSDYHNPGWGNNEQQYYREENSRVEDGYLKITAQVEDEDTQLALGKKYTSSKMVTKGLFSQTYGRFEARIKLTTSLPGLWPAFWMMPENSEYGGWPFSGEIDIMEIKGRLPDRASSAVHYRDGGAHKWHSDEYTFADTDVTEFHVYAVEWTPEKMEFSVDGNVYHTFTAEEWHTASVGEDSGPSAPFDKDFFIILNLAVGGNFDGGVTPPDEAMPAELWVDYVRVYSLEYLQQQEQEGETLPEENA